MCNNEKRGKMEEKIIVVLMIIAAAFFIVTTIFIWGGIEVVYTNQRKKEQLVKIEDILYSPEGEFFREKNFLELDMFNNEKYADSSIIKEIMEGCMEISSVLNNKINTGRQVEILDAYFKESSEKNEVLKNCLLKLQTLKTNLEVTSNALEYSNFSREGMKEALNMILSCEDTLRIGLKKVFM